MMTFLVLLIIVFVIIAFTRSHKANNQPKITTHKFVSRSGMENAEYSGNMFTSSRLNITELEAGTDLNEIISEFEEGDCLGKAAEAGNKAKQAVKNKEFDKAWELLHEQKKHYMEHANKNGFSARQVFSLDSNVHESLANILRVEGKHHDAFFHVLYWVIASYHRPIKKHQQKLRAYFNRCKFKNTSINDVNNYIEQHGKSIVNILKIKEQVAKWVAEK